MGEQEWWKKYIVPIYLNEAFVRIAGTEYPAESINPSGDNRYGQTAYVSSGLNTAVAEVGKENLDGKMVFPANSGVYWAFDQLLYCQHFPNARPGLMAGKDDGGYGCCRAFRNRIMRDSNYTVSGILWESTQEPGGLNLSLWDPSNSKSLPSGFFGPPAEIDGWGQEGRESASDGLINPDPF